MKKRRPNPPLKDKQRKVLPILDADYFTNLAGDLAIRAAVVNCTSIEKMLIATVIRELIVPILKTGKKADLTIVLPPSPRPQ